MSVNSNPILHSSFSFNQFTCISRRRIMSFFRRKKSSSEKEEKKEAATPKNVRVTTRNLDALSMTKTPTELPSTIEKGEQLEDNVVYSRQALKATAVRNQKRMHQSTTTQGKVEEDDDEEEEEEEEETELRTGNNSYGNARKDCVAGYYQARVTVKDWQFNQTHITVPLGCVVLFSVGKKERSMVEVKVKITNDTDQCLGTSPALSAGQVWEYFCDALGELGFEDVSDGEEMAGTITVVAGDEKTVRSHAIARTYQLDQVALANRNQKNKEKKEAEDFEIEMNKKMKESKLVDEEVNQTLARARSPSPTVQEVDDASDLDASRQKAVADSLAMYEQMKR